jgi:transcriptional regulator with XRE-family HTH domain
MRVTVRDFAEDLGVNPRTVSRWESAKEARMPIPELQRALDTMLDRATDRDRERFLTALGGLPGARAGSVSDVDRNQVRADQERWLRTRDASGARGRELSELSAAGGTGR